MTNHPKVTAKWLAIGLIVAETVHAVLALNGWFSHLLPQSLQQAYGTLATAPMFNIPILIVGPILLASLIVGLVGILLYKWWGRLLFSVFWAGNLIFLPMLPPEIMPSVEVVFNESKLLASGALLALVWGSSARALYARNA